MSKLNSLITSALSIDVEDGINIAMRDNFNISIPPTERVVQNTERILYFLQNKEVKATFFILGDVAANYPLLVKQIQQYGHEIGVHGYAHLQFFRMTRKEAWDDLIKAKDIIENITGIQAKGFRAPAFSITKQTSWALQLIANAGFEYDSSIMPKGKGRYGWPGFNPSIQKLVLPDGKELIEFPLSVVKFMGQSIPACGGGYLRLFPYSFTNWSFDRIIDKRPVVAYIHPYETDTLKYPDFYFQEMRKKSIAKQLLIRSYWHNRSTVLGKLDKLINNYKFDTMYNVIQSSKANILEMKLVPES